MPTPSIVLLKMLTLFTTRTVCLPKLCLISPDAEC